MPQKTKTPMSTKIRSDMFGTSVDLPRIIELDVAQVEVNPDQPRKFFDEDALLELAQSIETKGMLQPILVKALENDRYMIVAGDRRYRANQLISRATIAAVVTEGDVDEVAIIENVQRENLRPMELAESLDRLMQTHGYTQEEVANVIGKARNTVTELLSLLKLPEAIKAQCRTSDIASKSFLIELVRMDTDSRLEAWDALKNNSDVSVRSLRSRKNVTTKTQAKEDKQPDTPFQKAERALLIAVKALESKDTKLTKVEIETLRLINAKLDNVVAGLT